MIANTTAQPQDGVAGMPPAPTPAAPKAPTSPTAQNGVPSPTPTPTLPPPQMVPGSPVPASSAPPIIPSSSTTPQFPSTVNSGPPPGDPSIPPGVEFHIPSATPPSPTAGVATAAIDPTADLRSQVITPGADPRLQATQGNVSTLANNLTTGPNRFDLAQSNFDAFAKASEPQYQQDIRSATDAAAANGRLGSGMLSNNYETLAEARARALDTQRTSLLNDALAGTISDNQTNLGLMSGLENQQFGEGQSNRNEIRGERTYETNANQQAIENAAQEAQLEDSLTNSAFSRGADATQLGYSGNPSSAQLIASSQQGDQANQSFNDVGSLLRMMALSSALGGSGGASYGQPSSGGSTSGSGLQITPQMLQQFMSQYQNGGSF